MNEFRDWRVEPGAGGLLRLVFDRDGLFAEVYLNGAHVTAFMNRKQGLSMFWMDGATPLAGRAIRGGVPLVFPWFGPHRDRADVPRHGFARNLTWSIAGECRPEGAIAGVALEVVDNELTRVVWPHAFWARLEVGVEELALAMRMIVKNTDKTPFSFENALHSYFAVGDVRAICVEGLDGAGYIDKTDGAKRKTLAGGVRFTGERDNVFVDTTAVCRIREAGRATIRIEKSGSRETVVWNPGAKKGDPSAAAPPFVCVEPANCVDHPVTLAPGEEHALAARFAFELDAEKS